ncbi:MAG: hypothetical protein VX589_02640, partial [Myxococcota bacterium]|nr:hypothetical protein [Myxococcota bacterium]
MPGLGQGNTPGAMGGMMAPGGNTPAGDQGSNDDSPMPADGMGNSGSNFPSPPPGLPGSGSGNGNGGNAPPQNMGGTCIELNNCIVMCGNDSNCAQSCASRFPPEAVQQFSAIGLCAQRNQCGPGDQQCLNMNCACEIGVCQGSQQGPCAGADPMGCATLLQCLSNCAGNQQCGQQCGAAASQMSVQTYNALTQCLMTNNCIVGGGMVDQNCLQANCNSEFSACVAN